MTFNDMSNSRLFTRIQAVALVWLFVLVWLSQTSFAWLNGASLSDTSDDKGNQILNAIRPLESDLKPVQ
jgi:hypothetical protein